MEFLRRFLEHVLPSGFAEVRHYEFLSPSSAMSLELPADGRSAWHRGSIGGHGKGRWLPLRAGRDLAQVAPASADRHRRR